MTTTKQPDINKYWYSIFTKCEQSGKTIKNFCRIQNISLNKYMYWRRKLILEIKEPNNKPIISKTDPNTNKLQEIKILTSENVPIYNNLESKHIKIIYPNGIDIRIPITLHQEQVTAILSKIGGSLC